MEITVTATNIEEAECGMLLFRRFIIQERQRQIELEREMRRSRQSEINADRIGKGGPYPLMRELDLTVRTSNCLQAEGIYRVEELLTWSRLDLLRIPNLGPKSLNEIVEILALHDLSLANHGESSRDATPPELQPDHF